MTYRITGAKESLEQALERARIPRDDIVLHGRAILLWSAAGREYETMRPKPSKPLKGAEMIALLVEQRWLADKRAYQEKRVIETYGR